jgi:integrase
VAGQELRRPSQSSLWQKAGLKVPDFHPRQLRHTAAARIRKEMGLDAARAMLGHRNLKITADYAELDQALAGKAAMKLG